MPPVLDLGSQYVSFFTLNAIRLILLTLVGVYFREITTVALAKSGTESGRSAAVATLTDGHPAGLTQSS